MPNISHPECILERVCTPLCILARARLEPHSKKITVPFSNPLHSAPLKYWVISCRQNVLLPQLTCKLLEAAPLSQVAPFDIDSTLSISGRQLLHSEINTD